MEKNRLSKKTAYPVFIFAGFLFSFCCLTEYRLARDGNIVWTGGYLLGVLGASLALGILLGGAVCALMYTAARRADKEHRREKLNGKNGAFSVLRNGLEDRLSAGKCFLVSWLLMLAAWFPGFLAYYPAICAYDMPVQMGQIVDHIYVDHHPILHTLLIEGFLKTGKLLFGNVNTGIALYALVQMAVLSAALAGGIALLRRLRVKLPWLAALLVYGMFFPVHMYMSVSVTKDTVFSIFMLLQLLCLFMLVSRGENTWKPALWDWGYFIATLGMILFRTNGRYALLVLLVLEAAALIFSGKNKKFFLRLTANSLLGFLTGSILLSLLFRMTGAEQGDRREMLSMPIQQLSRCMLYHGGAGVLPSDDNTMGEQDKALINDFILNNGYIHYRPDISDPVKRYTNTYVFRYRTREFAGTYLRLLGRYTGDFVNAGLAVNAGYLYPWDVSHAKINLPSEENPDGLGYIQTRWSEIELNPWGIYKAPKWEWLHEKLEWFAENNAYLKLPLLKYLFVPGTYLWLYVLLACWLLLHRRFRLLLPLGLVFGYYCTLFLGPTVQLRYLYPVMIALPFLFVLCRSDIAADRVNVEEVYDG